MELPAKYKTKYEELRRAIDGFRKSHELQLDTINRVLNHTPLGPVRDKICQLRDDVQKITANLLEMEHQTKLTDFASAATADGSAIDEASAEHEGKDHNDGSREINVHPDKAHGDKPDHMDITVPIPEIGDRGGAHKLEVDNDGNIIGEQIWAGKKHVDIANEEAIPTNTESHESDSAQSAEFALAEQKSAEELQGPRQIRGEIPAAGAEDRRHEKESGLVGDKSESADIREMAIADETADLAKYADADESTLINHSVEGAAVADEGGREGYGDGGDTGVAEDTAATSSELKDGSPVAEATASEGRETSKSENENVADETLDLAEYGGSGDNGLAEGTTATSSEFEDGTPMAEAGGGENAGAKDISNETSDDGTSSESTAGFGSTSASEPAASETGDQSGSDSSSGSSDDDNDGSGY